MWIFTLKKKIKDNRIKLKKEINFKNIYYKDKDTIKLKDIPNLTIENLLLFKPKKINNNNNNKNDNKNDININNNKDDNKIDVKNYNKTKISTKRKKISYFSLNEEVFKEIKKYNIFSSDHFFKIPLKNLFLDIYYQKRGEIDLTKYEIKSKLPRNIKIFETLKKKYIKNKDIMIKLINQKFKKAIFKTDKKE